MSQDNQNSERLADPIFTAALDALLHEIEQEPVSPRLRELSARLQQALKSAADRRRD